MTQTTDRRRLTPEDRAAFTGIRPGEPASHTEVRPGAVLFDQGSGPCLVIGRPRHVAGGYVVDVEGFLWNGAVLPWCACLCNLRLPAGARVTGACSCPACGDRGPHDDNGASGPEQAFCCAACGEQWDAVPL